MKSTETSESSHWPPKSPYEALLSSPKGRRKLRAQDNSRQPSLSPLKKSSTTPNLRSDRERDLKLSGEDDEDEETLRLQLAAIEARLKIKKLQGKKAALHTSEENIENDDTRKTPLPRSGLLLSSRDDQRDRDLRLVRSNSTNSLQVPVSPIRRATPEDSAIKRSPSRVLLGIDKGLNGRNVSLRRAPSRKEQQNELSDPFQSAPQSRSRLQRTVGNDAGLERRPTSAAAKSFATRMAEVREKQQKEQRQRDRQERCREERSKSFAVDEKELSALKQAASKQNEIEENHSASHSSRAFSREEVLRGVETAHRAESRVSRKEHCPSTAEDRVNSRAEARSSRRPALGTRVEQLERRQTPSLPTSNADSENASTPFNPEAALFEPFSSCNLSRRVLPHTFVERTVEGKQTVVIPDLLQSIQGPEYVIPDELVENDFVLFALVASKSAPIEHKKPAPTGKGNRAITSGAEAEKSLRNEHGNYLVITLTDLRWTVDLFLFGAAFARFRKLTPGTLIAILNPEVMPPPRHLANTGRWSLKLTSAEVTVLEIGTSKDLGWCKSIKKDGQPCGAWVDRRHTEFCEFHTNLGVEKVRSGRMEVQGMSALFGPGGRQGSFGSRGGPFGNGQSKGTWRKGNKSKGKPGTGFDRESQSTYFVAPKGDVNQTAASLLDADEFMIRGGSQARQREILVAREKEVAIAESLGIRGDGAGADYLRSRSIDTSCKPEHAIPSAGAREGRDAKSLGLTGNKSTSILLSPLKRKRSEAGDETVTSTKKKTRFVTPNGIREAGRDSLNPYDSGVRGNGVLDEDDELDIV